MVRSNCKVTFRGELLEYLNGDSVSNVLSKEGALMDILYIRRLLSEVWELTPSTTLAMTVLDLCTLEQSVAGVSQPRSGSRGYSFSPLGLAPLKHHGASAAAGPACQNGRAQNDHILSPA